MTPGGTAIFEITYPVNANNVGKEFTITDCAFINESPTQVHRLVRTEQPVFVLAITLAVPADAPVGGLYCNYVKTRGARRPRRQASVKPARRASSFFPRPVQGLRPGGRRR